MKPLFYLSIILVTLTFVGCSKEDKPSPTPPVLSGSKSLLTLKVDASFVTTQSDNWVLIHDINGKILEYKVFETGDVVKIETTKEVPENKVSITFFEYGVFGSSISHVLQSYLLTEIGQEWTLKKDNYSSTGVTNIGDFNVTFTNLQPGSAYAVSNKNGMAGMVQPGGSWDGGTNTLSAKFPLPNNTSKFLFYETDNIGNPKYKFLDNIKDKDATNISYNSMDNFDKTVKVTFPKTSILNINYWVNSVENGQTNTAGGYLLDANLYNTYDPWNSANILRTDVTLGYLDTFANYKTSLYIRNDTYQYGYNKLGARPESIVLPLGATFSLTDKTLSNFKFENNQSFVNRYSYWQYNDLASSPTNTILWYVNAPAQGLQKISELPSEFATKYPKLSMDKLEHIQTDFSMQGESYSDLIERTFKGKARGATFEDYYIGVK